MALRRMSSQWAATYNPNMTNDVKLEIATKTDIGRVRLQNEDCLAVSPEYGFAVLADGMGGYSAGEVASRIAVEVLKSTLERELGILQSEPDEDALIRKLATLLDNSIQEANLAILRAARENINYSGMGTTIVASVIVRDRFVVAHVGDSRAYRLRLGALTQLTRDHSLLQEQIDAGLIDPEWAQFARHKNLVTRAVGVDAQMGVEVHDYWVQPGDVYLLCSDGLSDLLTVEEMESLFASTKGALQLTCDALVSQANERGGHDNISAILISVQSGPEQQSTIFDRIRSWIR